MNIYDHDFFINKKNDIILILYIQSSVQYLKQSRCPTKLRLFDLTIFIVFLICVNSVVATWQQTMSEAITLCHRKLTAWL